LVFQEVHFRNWKTWDEYYRNISTNSKRNYKRAVNNIEDLNIVNNHGLAAVTELWFLTKSKRTTSISKSLNFNLLDFVARFIVRSVLFGDRQFVSVVRSGRTRLVAISGIEFGSRLFYLDGGTCVERRGANWYLMIEALKEFRRRCPEGIFMMGAIDHPYPTHKEAQGVVRFRLACRVTNLHGCVVKFLYRPLSVQLLSTQKRIPVRKSPSTMPSIAGSEHRYSA
jgi:hypothetical protein